MSGLMLALHYRVRAPWLIKYSTGQDMSSLFQASLTTPQLFYSSLLQSMEQPSTGRSISLHNPALQAGRASPSTLIIPNAGLLKRHILPQNARHTGAETPGNCDVLGYINYIVCAR